ncbi:MAG: hypothetical protein RRY79_07640 [Clostridia bacterium]
MSRLLGAVFSILGVLSVLFSIMKKNGVFTGKTAEEFGKIEGNIGGYLGTLGISMSVFDFLFYGGIALLAIGLIFILVCRKR